MSKRVSVAIVLALCLMFALAVMARGAQPGPEEQSVGVDLTVYNQNVALVKDQRA
jgi:hypothetical protein